jgi:protein involved in ribonucleotide reduction
MLIVYDTFSGNTKDFVHKLPYECCHISEYDGFSNYILVTYTVGFGQTPDITEDFLFYNNEKMMGVSSSGNKIWGKNYAKAAENISIKYNVPLISKFELKGTKEDVKYFIERVDKICQNG